MDYVILEQEAGLTAFSVNGEVVTPWCNSLTLALQQLSQWRQAQALREAGRLLETEYDSATGRDPLPGLFAA